MSFLTELRRRNVIRMAGLYLVGAWLMVQVTETLLPIFHAPEWVLATLVVLLALGFVPALVFSWVFEMTPGGLKRDSDVAPEQSIAPQTARRMDRMILGALVLALAFFGFDRFVLAPRRDAALVESTTRAVKAEATVPAGATVERNSIAVLPFVNMSGEATNEYFSDGISEEILNVLAGTPALRVAARTSSFSFKGKALEIPEIARELKVRMVLEGSVRKQGDKVRITAQLIDAETGFHLWSQTYDRKLEDIFAIQDEIARAIGDALKVTIGGDAAPGPAAENSGGTASVEAYDLYLRGMALWHSRKAQALWDAIALFERAVALDPAFAQAHAGLALTYTIIGDYSNRLPYEVTLVRSSDAAERALALDPTLPEAWTALSNSAAKELRRETAAALLDRAIALRPSFATAHQWRGNLLMSNGDLAGGLASHERASELDPRALVVSENHAVVLRMIGRPADAKARCLRTLAFAPDFGPCVGDVAMVELELGDFAAAQRSLERLAALDNPSAAGQGRELFEALTGKGDARALAARYAALPYDSRFDPDSGNALEGYDMPLVLMLLGEPALALDYVEMLASKLGGTTDWTVMMPALDPIRCDPRFIRVVAGLKTTDPHFKRACAGKP